MANFISCDWGTSNFRLRLVDDISMSVHHEVESSDGIASLYRLWKDQEKVSTKIDFFLSFLRRHIQTLKSQSEFVTDIPIIISGMASSTIGLTELEYARLPAAASGSSLLIKQLESRPDFPDPVFIVSGVCTNDDIMRGEESLLAGCDTLDDATELFIFPGTHSKHVTVINGEAKSFGTYMTGELFDVLSRHSILSASMQPGDFVQQSFEDGVRKGAGNNLLYSAFKIRVNQVFHQYTPTENFHYLSGLLIGTELSEIFDGRFSRVTIVGSDSLRSRYCIALKLLRPTQEIVELNSNTAIVKGHSRIFRTLYKK